MTNLIDPAALTGEAVEARADLKLAAARLARAETTTSLERARGVPDLLVSGGYKRTSGFNTAVASVAVPLPVFDRNGEAVARASGEVGAARLELQQVRQLALVDAQVRWTAARELAVHAGRVEADLVAPAEAVRTAARAAFTEGRGDLLQLIDAERLFGDASREALDLQLDALLASIQARLAIGDTPLP
jgi:cobalt-zinc-cadmium efflux system outer membrane protein